MEKNLEELFRDWHDLNKQVEESFKNFDLSTVKEIRKQQSPIEDSIYSILLENASEDLKMILPDTCGEFEIGFDVENNKFIYVMLDPEYEESEETKLIAFTIDINKNIEIIKDFKEEF